MTTTNLLNAEFIKRRRVELSLSNRALASAIGITASGLRAFEHDASQGDITLAMLERLASALGCNVGDLIATPSHDDTSQDPADDGDAEPNSDEDAVVLGLALWASGTLTPIAALAEITGWTRRRVKDTLDVLEKRLAATGLALNRLDARVAIRGAGASMVTWSLPRRERT